MNKSIIHKTIGISESNYEKLRKLGEKGTTFDQIISKVLSQVTQEQED